MKTLTTLSLIGALALSATAFADDSAPSPDPHARRRPPSSAGPSAPRWASQLFRMTYGTNKTKRNAFGKCVSKRTHATTEAAKEASRTASRTAPPRRPPIRLLSRAKYGTGKHGANAHGKCVSQKAKSETAKTVKDEVKADVSAAKACKTERKADPAAFRAKYGTNKNKRNAFGKCVSKTAKAQHS